MAEIRAGRDPRSWLGRDSDRRRRRAAVGHDSPDLPGLGGRRPAEGGEGGCPGSTSATCSSTVLLVEDNPSDAGLLAAELLAEPEWAGELLRAARLTEALEIVEGGGIDAVLLDLSLPDSHGPETVQRLVGARPGMAIVVLTGTDDQEVAIEALKAGANEYLVKGEANGGQIVRSIIYGIEQARVQAALRLTRYSVDRAVDAVFWITPEARIIDVNEAACRSLGYSRDELLAMLVHDFHPAVRRGHWAQLWRQIRARRRMTLETHYLTRSGRRFPVEITANHVEFGGDEYVCAFARDVTERREAKVALEESEERYRNLIDSLADIVYAGEITGDPMSDRLYFVSAQAEEILGLPSEVFVEDAGAWRRLVEPADLGEFEATTRRAIDSGQVVTRSYRVRRADSQEQRWLEDRFVPRLDGEGRCIAFTGIARDVTHEKELEAQVRQSQKLEALAALAGGIAHDFNNVLQAILGYTEVAVAQLPAASPPAKSLAHVIEAANRASQLVAQILTFARRQEQPARPVRVDRLVREALKMLRAALPSTIEVREHVEALSVLADATRIHQVVMNLCTNAYHAMRETGGVLEVTLEPVSGDAPAGREGSTELTSADGVCLTVKDSGQGMEAAIRERIFEPFFTTKAQHEGTGMGLSTVHGIVSSLSGSIAVESEPGQGSTFRVFLPRCEEQPEVVAPEGCRRPAGAGERILVVDDEEAIARLEETMLRRLGYRPVAVWDSEEAWRRLCERPDRFDLVLTDQTMPHLTGRDLAARIRRLRPDLPVLLATGYSDSLSAEVETDEAVTGLLLKPLSYDVLATEIHAALLVARG